MSTKAKALQTIYKAGKIGINSLKIAVAAGNITTEEYEKITGKKYEA